MLNVPPPFGAPEPTAARKPFSRIRQIAAGLAIVIVVAGLGGTLLVIHAAAQPPRLGAGPAATATPTANPKDATATTTSTAAGTPTATPLPGATAPPPQTPTPTPQGDVRVTQNQDMRLPCLNNPAAYTVMLNNAGDTTANWHVSIPQIITGLPHGSAAAAQRLRSPLSSSPWWAQANPQDGSVAPGQTASFVMSPDWIVPCGGKTYQAAVQLTFPSGATQPDIPLTYGGTGPAPYSNVVLVAGSLTNTEACPASGTAPAPFTFAIQNTGNATAYPSIDTSKDNIGINPWANASVTYSPPNPAVGTWLYAGETWTVTVAPISAVSCDGTVYHVYVYINNAQGTSQTMTFTDTFH